MEPYEARFLEFGDSLDKIPVPEEDMLPPVDTVPEKEEGGDKNGVEDDDPGDDGSNESGSTDKPGSSEDTKARIAELEAKGRLTAGEKKELSELKKKAKEAEGQKGGKANG
jgi:hypothetical protein